MIEPEKVISPKSRLEGPVQAVASHRRDGEHGPPYSIARFKWEKAQRVGIRWDGDPANPHDVGNPQSRGLPTWFILPDDIAKAVLKHIDVSPTTEVVTEPDPEAAIEARLEAAAERVLNRLLDERGNK